MEKHRITNIVKETEMWLNVEPINLSVFGIAVLLVGVSIILTGAVIK